jgi:hypothetical protein
MSEELSGFEREAAIVRSLADDPVELVDAPDHVWSAIEAAAGAPDATDAGDPTAPSSPTPIASRRRARRRILIPAAAAVVAVLIGVGVFALQDPDGPTQLAAAELTAFEQAPVGEAGGTVELIADGDDERLEVAMHDLPAPAPGTYYELWLLDPESGEPVSVATMRDGSSEVTTSIPVPEGVDTSQFDVVDVSVQEEAAGPEHSGNSVLRGTLA